MEYKIPDDALDRAADRIRQVEDEKLLKNMAINEGKENPRIEQKLTALFHDDTIKVTIQAASVFDDRKWSRMLLFAFKDEKTGKIRHEQMAFKEEETR
jgi:hypothetical protein